MVTMKDAVWYRGHRARYDPIHFNRGPAGRFNAPDAEFGVLYLGESDLCAFVEAFCHDERQRVVSEYALALSCLCPITTKRAIRLVDLTTGVQLRRLGGDSRICDGPWSVSRRWALALWQHSDAPDGLLYRSRIAPEMRAIALFDRAGDAITADCGGNVLIQSEWLGQILDYHEIALT